MDGYLKVICANNGADDKINRIKTFIAAINTDNIYEQTAIPYWKDEDCVVIESHFKLQSINKDDIIRNVMLLTDRTAIDSITDTDLHLELECYVSINDMILNPDRFFCILFINKAI